MAMQRRGVLACIGGLEVYGAPACAHINTAFTASLEQAVLPRDHAEWSTFRSIALIVRFALSAWIGC